MEKFFPSVRRKPVELNNDQILYLGKIASLLQLVEEHRAFWKVTNGVVTLERLAVVESTLVRVSAALKADTYRLERFAAAVYGKSLKDFVKAIRCPSTNDASVQNKVHLFMSFYHNHSSCLGARNPQSSSEWACRGTS
jgi:hypothetical protein